MNEIDQLFYDMDNDFSYEQSMAKSYYRSTLSPEERKLYDRQERAEIVVTAICAIVVVLSPILFSL